MNALTRQRAIAKTRSWTAVRYYASSINTVNQDEVDRFSALSKQWWNPKGEYRVLHQMNPTRIHFLRERLGLQPADPYPLRGKSILDIGCGGGLFAESLTRLGGNVLAVDATFDNVQMAKLHASQDPDLSMNPRRQPGSLEYRHTTAEELASNPKLAGSFDLVTCMEVLEHVDQPSSFLRVLNQLLKEPTSSNGLSTPGGQLFMSTISRTPLSYFLTVFVAEDLLRIVPKKTHTWDKFVRPDELESFASLNLGLVDTEIRGTIYIPWEGRWRLADSSQQWAAKANYFFAATRGQ